MKAVDWGEEHVIDGDGVRVRVIAVADLLLPHIGAVAVDGSRGRRTLDADEAVALQQLVYARSMIPIHHTTFSHYREPVAGPIQRAAAAHLEGRLQVLAEEGESVDFP